MKKIILCILIACCSATTLYAGQSIITEGEGYACMGEDKSRKATETTATADAKRKATESASTYIKSETHVKDAMLEKDLLAAYANAQVRVLQELLKEWYKEQGLGDCYRVKLKVEVIPDEKAMTSMAKKDQESLESDPSAPLSVRIWTDRKEYREGDKMRVYLKANKPFYARVVYRQADASLMQLLPNPYRIENYFSGGTVYELPAGGDQFDLEVAPPLGSEAITVYASTAQLGDMAITSAGPVYAVRVIADQVPLKSRGIQIKKSDGGRDSATAEFAEAVSLVTTGKFAGGKK